MTTDIKRLAARIANLEKRVRRGNTAPQLAHSSVENGSIDVNAIDGTTSMVIGKQEDGTHAPAVVAGPNPPQPTGVTCQPGLACIQAAWSGAFLNSLVAPGDFGRAEFHISTEGPDFIPDLIGDGSTTLFATLDSPRGGEVAATGLMYVDHWIRVVIRSLSGKFSTPSEATTAIPLRVNGPDIQVGSITGELLAGDIVLGSRISTGDIDRDESSPTFGQIIGQRLELGQEGFRVVQADGQDIINFSTDPDQPAIIRAHIETDSLRALGGVSIESRNNEIAKDAWLALANGITAPNQGPVLTSGYDSVRFDTTTKASAADGYGGGDLGNFAFNPSQAQGIGYTGSAWLVVQKVAGGSRIWGFEPDGSLALSGGVPYAVDFEDWTITGVCVKPGAFSFSYIGKVGGQWYLIGQPVGENLAGYFNKITLVNPGQTPTLSYDAAADNYVISETNPANDRVRVRRFTITANNLSPTTNAHLVSTTDLPTGTGRAGSLSGLLYGSFDFGASRYLWAARGSYSTVWSSTSGATQAAENFPLPSSGMNGFDWDGTNFWSLGSDGTLYKHEAWTFTDSATKAFAAVTNLDTDPAGTGTHETDLGYITGITRKKRAKIQVTIPGVPDKGGVDDPDRWALYVALSLAEPAPADFHFQASGYNAVNPNLPTIFDLVGFNPAGAAPPSINSFPGASPARIYTPSAADVDGSLINLQGDGTWRLGPMKSTDGVTIVRKDEQKGQGYNLTPSGGGQLVIAHTLGVTPSNVQVTAANGWTTMGGMWSAAVVARTNADFTVSFRYWDNSSVTVPVWFDWVARA